MTSRRAFLSRLGSSGSLVAAALNSNGLALMARAAEQVRGRSAADIAADEDFWREVQLGFTLDRTVINLNNGGVCPSPRVVHEAFKRYLDHANQAPVFNMWQEQEPNLERVRAGLAQDAGCDVEELAITRNASEALQIAQLGIDLKAGDEVVTTTQDYGRMLDTWEQRARRDGITLTKISFPVPPPSMADLTQRLERALGPRTKVLHFCHITNLTGQIFPVTDICRIARVRGIQTIVDGAHAFGHFPFAIRDLGCDYYGTSLHKWLLAPIGTGFLYVRRERIPDLWPLTPAAGSKAGDIRKFEEIGTHPAANHNAIAEARVYHHTIGGERKIARLRYLRDRWMRRLADHPKARILTSFDPAQSGAIGNVSTPGLDPARLAAHLYAQHRIIVTPIKHAEFEGMRVTPNVYTTLEEVDTFATTMERILEKGLPATA
ncbi:Isopenicillin N epimerase [Luteitalea pratensis]|uniref:Isopenicillin N epimerase n=1 Tax=Luteitalea pratensis TaxID=1855912 RepID=A0A143PYQ6_LUTPR|nr:aminotransferase class V-fold PLP-dependent enzyme [Luteitalea pratensis]AMY12919.1 Isopenicillin N epimerase [Luteitalea pratensis]